MPISKKDAIAIVSRACGSSLQSTTTHFANVNSSKSVWWFDIAVEKFTSGVYESLDLLVVTSDGKVVHYLHVPTSYVSENISSFHIRKDKKSVSLELSTEQRNIFQDIRPGGNRMQFDQFLVDSLSITPANVADNG